MTADKKNFGDSKNHPLLAPKFFCLVGRYDAPLAVESLEVGPAVERCLCGGHGQRGLAAVKQAFDKNVVGARLAVEYELDVGGHAGLPVLVTVLHLIRVFRVKVGAIDAHQHGERTDVGVVPESQVCQPVAASLQPAVSLAEDVFENGDGLVAWTEYP